MDRKRALAMGAIGAVVGFVTGALVERRVSETREVELAVSAAAADAQTMFELDHLRAGDSNATISFLEMRLEGAKTSLAAFLAADESLGSNNPRLVTILKEVEARSQRRHAVGAADGKKGPTP